MLRAEGIRAAYGTDEILHGVDIDLHPGEAVALLGPNGSGKTTLLRVLAGSLMPTAGMVQVQGADIRRLSPRERARRVAVLSQRSAAPQGMTALQMVLLGRYPWLGWWGSYSAEDRRIAHEALEETGALPLAGRQVSELSGGELQRVALARTLAQQSPVLLLDELAAGLDLARMLELFDLLERRRRAGAALLLVMHDGPVCHPPAGPARGPRIVRRPGAPLLHGGEPARSLCRGLAYRPASPQRSAPGPAPAASWP